jgi:hypothetical protein
MCVIGRILIRPLVVAGILSLGLTDLARATPIVSITGPDNPFGSIPGIEIGNGRVTQWQSTLAFEDVTVTADLSSVPSPSGTATAFLTTRIGPGTTAADEVARATVALPDFFAPSHTVTLFTGLNLAPAHYYLTIVSSPTNAGIWRTSDSTQAQIVGYPCGDAIPCPVIIPGFPNWQMFTLQPNAYAPASVWTPFHFSAGEMRFAVDGTLARETDPTDPPTDPPTPVPEPGTLMLTLAGLAAAARKVRARRKSTPTSVAL